MVLLVILCIVSKPLAQNTCAGTSVQAFGAKGDGATDDTLPNRRQSERMRRRARERALVGISLDAGRGLVSAGNRMSPQAGSSQPRLADVRSAARCNKCYASVCRRYPATSPMKRCTDASAIR